MRASGTALSGSKELMMRLKFLLFAVLFLLAAASGTKAMAAYKFAISMEALANSADAGRGPRCQASLEAEMGKPGEWWMAMGAVQPSRQDGWTGVDNKIRCGIGSPKAPNETSGASQGPPYLLATVSTVAGVLASRLGADNVLQVGISLSVRKLTDFSATGEPRYQQSELKRMFFFSEYGIAFLPLMMADDKEKEAFKLHEVLVGIGAKLARKQEGATYGALSVTSDIDGAEILLDGGVVGKVSAGKETILKNVLVGEREVSVRDRTGRMVRRVVRVEGKRTAMVSLALSAQAGYRLVSVGKNGQGYAEYRRERDGAVVVKIPAGEFLMGDREAERQPAEHKVYLSEFLMDKTAVTWRQFKIFLAATGNSLPPNPPYWGILEDHPAAFVTWEEAKAFCEWSGARLPTEAEREKAARGTDGRKYPWGNEEPDPDRAVFRRNWGDLATDPVGAHPSGASPYGLLDMGGNVWEFVADWYDEKYYEVSPAWVPKGPRTRQARVVRGGSWDSRPSVLNASVRNWAYRGYREGDFGFRCAMDSVGD